MSVLVFCVGTLAAVAGAVMIGFGIPISEFSFGNTLIAAGTTAAVGGLILIGLGAVVGRLQRIAEALGSQMPSRPGRPLDMFENASGARAPAPSRIPFPAKPKFDATREPMPAPRAAAIVPPPLDIPVQDRPAETDAPTLRNPDEPPVTVEDNVSLSPQQPFIAPAREEAVDLDRRDSGDARQEPTLDAGWRTPLPQASTRQTHSSYFDAMWPADSRTAKSATGSDAEPEPDLDQAPHESVAEPAMQSALDEPALYDESEVRSVAILKSGVVDGMAYTLYVDGSIEAELPQGTLRFASINELRSHLEQNA
jgi:hypothetical protein